MTSQGVKFKAQTTKLRISLEIIGQSTLNLPSLLHPNKYTSRCIFCCCHGNKLGSRSCRAEMIIPAFDLQQRLTGFFSSIRRPSVM